MPIFFASNAIYPIDRMRALILRQGVATIGLGIDFAVLSAGCIVLTANAARLYLAWATDVDPTFAKFSSGEPAP